jgi:hypothetical protein
VRKVEYVREVVNSNTLTGIFNLPASLLNRRVEVVISPADDNKIAMQQPKSLRGCLSKYANPELTHLEKGAWAEAVGEKYADR